MAWFCTDVVESEKAKRYRRAFRVQSGVVTDKLVVVGGRRSGRRAMAEPL